MKKLGLPLIAGMGVMLSGCLSDGTVDNFFKRKASWASFLGGGDIKQTCEAGSPDHIRAVYNADRSVQVRIYDLQANGNGHSYRTRILAHAVGSKALPLFDPASWVIPSDMTKEISQAEWVEFKKRLETDGIHETAPEGRTLFSGSFFWIVSGCLDGQFKFNVWEYPDQAFRDLGLAAFLFDRDRDPIPVHKPKGDERITKSMLSYQNYNRSGFTHYDLRVGDLEILHGREYDPTRNY